MGIFFEETLNTVKTNDSITLAEMQDLIKENSELISDLLEMTITQLNESMIFSESMWDDLKIKKEDLMDPNKIKSLIKKIENERLGVDRKAQLLNALFIFLLLLAGAAPGAIISSVGWAMKSFLFMEVGDLIMVVGVAVAAICGLDRHETLKNKTKKAIKKVEKAISKETDPKNKKVLEDQKKSLEKTYEIIEKEQIKRKKDIDKKVRYGGVI